MLWTPVIHGNARLCFYLLSACFKPRTCARQDGWQHGWLLTKPALEWEICFGNTVLMPVEEAVEHGQGMIIDLKKCVLVQRLITSNE